MIRKATYKDLDNIMSIQHETYGPELYESSEIFLKIINYNISYVYTIDDITGRANDIPVAYILIHTKIESDRPSKLNECKDSSLLDDCFFIHDLCVHKKYQGQGLAKKLYNYIYSILDGPIQLISLKSAKVFWNKMGFFDIISTTSDIVSTTSDIYEESFGTFMSNK